MRIKVSELKKLISESASEVYETAPSSVEMSLNEVVDTWVANMVTQYDPADASMSHLGADAWRRQVVLASRTLKETLANALENVENDLTNGEFYS